MATKLRVALFGSPAFALPTLEALARHHSLELVVTQPDKPAGRGMRVRSPAVAVRARELGVRLEQPARLKRNEEFHELVRALDLDVAVTAAYGRILPTSLLELPRHGFLNVHGSLLPKYRGAAPVQWALIRGERVTGVTIMQTEAGLDTGPVRLRREVPVLYEGPSGPTDAASLMNELAVAGAEAITEALALLGAGDLPSVAQDDSLATLAPPLTPQDGWVQWADSASAIFHRHLGVAMWPGSSFAYSGERVKAEELSPYGATDDRQAEEPGTVLAVTAEGLLVAAGAGAVLLRRVKAPGKRAMAARDWANGHGVKVGTTFA